MNKTLKSTQYLFGIEAKVLLTMDYPGALRYKLEKAKELRYKLVWSTDVNYLSPHEEYIAHNEHIDAVDNAIAHTKALIKELYE